MELFKTFLKDLKGYAEGEITLEDVQQSISRINKFLYQSYPELGATAVFDGEVLQYISEFHKFWENNYQRVLNTRINKKQCKIAAECLKSATKKYDPDIFFLTHDTFGIDKNAIAQVRFFTSSQDFRGPLKNQYQKYLDDPSKFDAEFVHGDPIAFLKYIGVTGFSQTDKRLDYAKNSAELLLNKEVNAHDLAEICNNDALKIRNLLISTPNIGYGRKKADMFIRDMFALGVWPHLSNFDKIDVASDVNTMKVALRMRIIETDVPLLSSFLDIFCYQYGEIDEKSALAWRSVWEEWKKIDPQNALKSPCLIDFLIFRIGRECCKEILNLYQCESNNDHLFYWFSSNLKSCLTCREQDKKSNAHPTKKLLPCQVDSSEMPRGESGLKISDKKILHVFDGECIFKNVCRPGTPEFKKVSPPKSISIKGRTGWLSARTTIEEGGGGLMS